MKQFAALFPVIVSWSLWIMIGDDLVSSSSMALVSFQSLLPSLSKLSFSGLITCVIYSCMALGSGLITCVIYSCMALGSGIVTCVIYSCMAQGTEVVTCVIYSCMALGTEVITCVIYSCMAQGPGLSHV